MAVTNTSRSAVVFSAACAFSGIEFAVAIVLQESREELDYLAGKIARQNPIKPECS
jgi:hypothetical protein